MIPELITGGVVAASFIYLFILFQKKSAELDKTTGMYATIIEKAMQSERDRQAAITELDFLRQSIVQLMARKIELTLTDQQINQIVIMVSNIVKPAIEPKEKSN